MYYYVFHIEFRQYSCIALALTFCLAIENHVVPYVFLISCFLFIARNPLSKLCFSFMCDQDVDSAPNTYCGWLRGLFWKHKWTKLSKRCYFLTSIRSQPSPEAVDDRGAKRKLGSLNRCPIARLSMTGRVDCIVMSWLITMVVFSLYNLQTSNSWGADASSFLFDSHYWSQLLR